jgi:hypothetical protein
MPVDRASLAALPRLVFGIQTLTRTAKSVTFAATLEGVPAAAFRGKLGMRGSTATLQLDLASVDAGHALLRSLDGYLARPLATYTGATVRSAKITGALWIEPDDPLISTKLSLAKGNVHAEIYVELDPDARLGWFRQKGVGDEDVTTLLAGQLGLVREPG